MRFRWWRVINKEYTSTYTGITGILALLAYELLSEPGHTNRGTYLIIGAVIWGCSPTSGR
jgi:hypothetical protein